MRPGDDWLDSFFREEVFTPGQAEALAVAPAEARFVAQALGLRRGDELLDLCCGTGRHSLALARRGARVVGVDRTGAYLAQARRQARGGNPVFLEGDMRRLSFRERFDAAINLWTSFGYFEDPRDDLEALRGVERALKPGGRFLIDLVNAAWLERNFQERSWHRRADGAYVLETARRSLGKDPGVVNEWTVVREGRPAATARFFVRSYDHARLSALLRRAGLRVVGRWSSLQGAPASAGAARLVLLSEKPAPRAGRKARSGQSG